MFEYSLGVNVRYQSIYKLFLASILLTSFFVVSPLFAAPFLDEVKAGTDKLQNTINQTFGAKKKEKASPPPTVLVQSEVARRDGVRSRTPRKSLYSRRVLKRNKHMVSILAGEFGSADSRMAADIANVLDKDAGDNQMRILPLLGKGGLQNVMDVLFLKGVDMTIISQGQLGFLELQDPKFFKDIRENIQYVTKLYNSEFQILAHRRIASVADLKGKKVVLGKKLGATDMDARYIFSQLGIDIEVVNTDFSNGIHLLENDEVDAVVSFGGAPVDGFSLIRDPAFFHFLAITPQTVGLNSYFKIINEYLPIKLTSKHYPNLIEDNKPIATISSSVVLASYKWKREHKRYKKLSRFVNVFFDNLYSFDNKSRHSKWADINVEAKVAGWTQFRPAKEWLANRRKEIGQEVSAGEMKIAMDAFVRQYSKIGNIQQVSPLQRDDIWASMTRVFGRWWAIEQ